MQNDFIEELLGQPSKGQTIRTAKNAKGEKAQRKKKPGNVIAQKKQTISPKFVCS